MRIRAVLGLVLCTLSYGQTRPPSFDVTLVKPHDFSKRTTLVSPTCAGGRFTARAATAMAMIRWAYSLKPHQIPPMQAKLPGWARVGSRSFDIEAKSENPVTEAQCRILVQSLLRDRFQFSAHWETSEGQVYDVTVPPGGHKLKQATASDRSPVHLRIDGFDVRLPAEVEHGLSISDLTPYLAGFLRPQAPLTDRTGLDGLYKIDLAFSLPPNPGAGKQARRPQSEDPELEAALNEQLGLRLIQRRGPVELLIVDRIELPDEN